MYVYSLGMTLYYAAEYALHKSKVHRVLFCQIFINYYLHLCHIFSQFSSTCVGSFCLWTSDTKLAALCRMLRAFDFSLKVFSLEK